MIGAEGAADEFGRWDRAPARITPITGWSCALEKFRLGPNSAGFRRLGSDA